jgi:hypothetical protein
MQDLAGSNPGEVLMTAAREEDMQLLQKTLDGIEAENEWEAAARLAHALREITKA